MEKLSKHPQSNFVLDPVYRSSLVLRSSDLTTAKNKYYDVDLEGQKVARYEEGNEKSLLTNSSVKTSRPRRACNLCCCYCFYFIFILLLVLGIVVLQLIPKDPALSLGALHLPEFVYNDSSSSVDGPQIQASLSFDLNVTNRNSDADAIYREISVSVLYKNETLGRISREAFDQKKKMTTTVFLELPETVTTIQTQANADSLKMEVAASNVQVEVRGKVKGTHKVLGVKVKSFDIDIHCKFNVKPGDGSVGSQAEEISHSCYYDA